MKFHPIRKSWDLDEEVLKEVDSSGEGSAIVDVEDVGVEDIEVGGIEGKDIEVEDIGEADEEIVLTGSGVDTPSSPAPSVLANDGLSLPPSSDASMEFDDTTDGDDEVPGLSILKRKALDELGVGTKSRWKVARREETRISSDDGSGVETDNDSKRSRSAIASRKLRDAVKSGNFSANERKRKAFEDKCIKIDCGAKFCYKGVWRVLHSKCLMWYKMSEPYNTSRFSSHTERCKAKGNQRNTSITSFFKPRDPSDASAEAKPKIAVSGRNQIFVGGSTPTLTSIRPPHTDNQLISQRVQPCLGISDTQDSRVSKYISRTVVEGAGSISLQKVIQRVYGDSIKYSELTEDQKATVAVTQSHFRSWSINRELQVVFSTDCLKFIEQDQQSPKTICSNCEKVAKSDAFKRSLRVKPPPVEVMKYIPIKYRTALADLGAKFAHIQGLSELLKDVSSCFYPSRCKRCN